MSISFAKDDKECGSFTHSIFDYDNLNVNNESPEVKPKEQIQVDEVPIKAQNDQINVETQMNVETKDDHEYGSFTHSIFYDNNTYVNNESPEVKPKEQIPVNDVPIRTQNYQINVETKEKFETILKNLISKPADELYKGGECTSFAKNDNECGSFTHTIFEYNNTNVNNESPEVKSKEQIQVDEVPIKTQNDQINVETQMNVETIVKNPISKPADELYKCGECTKTFLEYRYLINHLRRHIGIKSFQCSQCVKAFSHKGDLLMHERIHSGEKPFQCIQCDKNFLRNSHLASHMKTHTDEKPYQCSECGNAFAHKGDLTKHQRIHSGEKPYECSRCDKSFALKKTLTNHFKTHTGEKPYQCSQCEKAFSVKCNLTKHQKIHARENNLMQSI